MDGQYEPIATLEVEVGVLQGYSAALGLLVRWEHGELRWRDPRTGREIPTFEQEREARLAEQEARLAEQEARLAAEARVRELEAETGAKGRRRINGRRVRLRPQAPAAALANEFLRPSPLSPAQYSRLLASIRARGLIHPTIVWRDQIIDGVQLGSPRGPRLRPDGLRRLQIPQHRVPG